MCNINDVSDDNTVDILSNILSNVLAIMDATRYISLHKCDFKPATFDNISVSSSRTDDNKVSIEVVNRYGSEFSTANFNEQLSNLENMYQSLMDKHTLSGYFTYRSSMIDVLIDVDSKEIVLLKFTDSIDIFSSYSQSISESDIKGVTVTNVTNNVFTILERFNKVANIKNVIFNMLSKSCLISNNSEIILQKFTQSQARLLALYYVLDYSNNHGVINIFDYKPLNKELEQLIFLNELAAVVPCDMVFKFGIFRAGRGYVDIDNSFEVVEIYNYLKAMADRLKNLIKLYPPKYNNGYGVGNYIDKCFMKILNNSLYVYHSYSKSYYKSLIYSFGEIASKKFSQVVVTFKNTNSSSISLFQNGKLQYFDDSANVFLD
jgi:hypothetical protein